MIMDSTLLRSFAATVDWIYAGMIPLTTTPHDPGEEPGLGGSLFYAGELDGAGCALVAAGNIAGAATLAATADVATQKQAIRDGVIDFLVTTLDEALRILKNEIRKRETVAVCVAQAPEEVESAMAELGVLPDLLPPGTLDAPRFEVFIAQGARQVNPASLDEKHTVLTWSVEGLPAIWLPKLDAIASECLDASRSPRAWSARRWLRHSPRYLGRLAHGVRLLRCETEVAHAFLNQARKQVASGQIEVAVKIGLVGKRKSEKHELLPPAARAKPDDS